MNLGENLFVLLDDEAVAGLVDVRTLFGHVEDAHVGATPRNSR